MRQTIRTLASAGAAALVLGLAAAGPAAAGEQYVDETGYAVSGYDVVAFFDKEQSPVGRPQPRATPGRAEFTTEWNGARWAFASAENMARFRADPARYAPAYDGHCAYGVAKGGKVPGNPNLWRIVDGTLYLNINPAVVGFWEADIPGQIETAEGAWPGLEDQAASDARWTALSANDPTYDTVGPVAD